MQVVNSRSEICAVSSESYLVHMCIANFIEKTNTKTYQTNTKNVLTPKLFAHVQ